MPGFWQASSPSTANPSRAVVYRTVTMALTERSISSASARDRQRRRAPGAASRGRCSTRWGSTHATVIARPGAHHVPGEHLSVSGKIDDRTLAGPGGEAPPSGSYLVLVEPLIVGSSKVNDIFLEGRKFDQGKNAKLYGRLEARSYGGIETGSHPYIALSGISAAASRRSLSGAVARASCEPRDPLGVGAAEVVEQVGMDTRSHDLEGTRRAWAGAVDVGIAVGDVDAGPMLRRAVRTGRDRVALDHGTLDA